MEFTRIVEILITDYPELPFTGKIFVNTTFITLTCKMIISLLPHTLLNYLTTTPRPLRVHPSKRGEFRAEGDKGDIPIPAGDPPRRGRDRE